MVSSQVADRLVQRDLRITEGEPGGTDYLYAEGATGDDYIGRTEKKADDLPPRVARLTGVYVIGDNFVYLSAKITRLVDHTVISAHNWTIPISDNVREMLPQLKRPGEGMTPLCRDPIRIACKNKGAPAIRCPFVLQTSRV